MLAAKGMLEALGRKEVEEDYRDCNDDHDFSKVLEFCGSDEPHDRELLCSDGQKRKISFEK